MYNRAAWMSKLSVETPFWFYFNDDGWNQSERLQSRLRAIPEFERERVDSKIAIALHPMLDAPIDDVAKNLMSQVLRVMDINV